MNDLEKLAFDNFINKITKYSRDVDIELVIDTIQNIFNNQVKENITMDFWEVDCQIILDILKESNYSLEVKKSTLHLCDGVEFQFIIKPYDSKMEYIMGIRYNPEDSINN